MAPVAAPPPRQVAAAYAPASAANPVDVDFTSGEEEKLIAAVQNNTRIKRGDWARGVQWVIIADAFPGREASDCYNHWHLQLKPVRMHHCSAGVVLKVMQSSRGFFRSLVVL